MLSSLTGLSKSASVYVQPKTPRLHYKMQKHREELNDRLAVQTVPQRINVEALDYGLSRKWCLGPEAKDRSSLIDSWWSQEDWHLKCRWSARRRIERMDRG